MSVSILLEALNDGGFVNKKEIENCAAKNIIIYAKVTKPKEETRDPHQPLPKDSKPVAEKRKRMGTEAAKEIYKERAGASECVNAIARNRGLQHFTVRGLEKAKITVLWFALAHNGGKKPHCVPLPRFDQIKFFNIN